MCISLFILISLLSISVSAVYAEIIVFDSITTIDRPVMLRALTKGRFFPSGGRIVKFFINGKVLGTTLSGGDGYAFFEFIPEKTGLLQVMARSDNEKSTGFLLVCNRGDKLFFVEVENALMGSVFSRNIMNGADVVLRSLMKNFRIIYVTNILGISAARQWIKDKGLPSSVVIKLESEDYISNLQAMGLIPYAMVGSPGLLAQSEGTVKKRFSFVPLEGVTEIKDWFDLRKKLYQKSDK
ncbi:MAG: hypothetical protein GXO97_07200 [Nitrospirae bacterium]|nr:hypothetical protein [Nitrospirota bacterium]